MSNSTGSPAGPPLSHHGDQHPEDERGRVYDNVENVHRIRPKAEPKQENAEKAEASEGEFNDIPISVACGGPTYGASATHEEFK